MLNVSPPLSLSLLFKVCQSGAGPAESVSEKEVELAVVFQICQVGQNGKAINKESRCGRIGHCDILSATVSFLLQKLRGYIKSLVHTGT